MSRIVVRLFSSHPVASAQYVRVLKPQVDFRVISIGEPFQIGVFDCDHPHPRIVPTSVCDRLVAQTLGVVRAMAVHDFKIAPSGEPTWLELNPQGQFLFLQEATGIDLASACGDFMLACAQEKRVNRCDNKASQ